MRKLSLRDLSEYNSSVSFSMSTISTASGSVDVFVPPMCYEQWLVSNCQEISYNYRGSLQENFLTISLRL